MSRAAVLTVALLAAACRSGLPVKPFPDGPLGAGALGRTAFSSPHATLLARDEDAAQDAADFAARVAGDFEERTGRPAAARVLIVAGSGGWIDGLPRRLELAEQGDAALRAEPPPTAERLALLSAELLGEQAGLGLPPALLLALRADVLRVADLDSLGLPPAAAEAFDWGLGLPTEDELEESVELSIDAALEQDEVTFAMRLLVAPLLPFVRGAMEDALRAEMQGVLFLMHAAAQPDWSVAERLDAADDYVAELTDEEGTQRPLVQPAAAGGPTGP